MSDLKINTKFAEKYEKYRQKEELQRRKLFHLTLETRARAVVTPLNMINLRLNKTMCVFYVFNIDLKHQTCYDFCLHMCCRSYFYKD